MTYASTLARQCLDRAASSTGTEHLRNLSAAVANVQSEIQRSVEKLREEGMSWAQIGDALGVSKQAAQQRYSRGW